MRNSKKITIVAPVFNEEQCVSLFYERVCSVIDQCSDDFSFLFIDDGSGDKTVELIRGFAESDKRVHLISFSRNFGSHAALLAGLTNAKGDAAIMMSVDLQDPPELIPKLLERWKENNDVVWAVRESRSDPWLKKVLASTFYKLLKSVALKDYPSEGMDFGLFDRCVLDELKKINELNSFLVGTIVWMGYRQAMIPYDRSARIAGVSKWPFLKRLKAALDAIVSFSYLPIRLISGIGFLISSLSMGYALFVCVRKIFFSYGGDGWPSLMVAVLFLSGLQMIMLGILGEYLWRVSDQTKGRPPFIISKKDCF